LKEEQNDPSYRESAFTVGSELIIDGGMSTLCMSLYLFALL
jgi:hypothetical protein